MRTRDCLLALAIFSALLALSACDCVSAEDGEIKAEAALPLLPFDLPLFPTDLKMDGLVDSIQEEVSGAGFLSDSFIGDFLDDVEEGLEEASLEILQPGTLSTPVNDQITDTFQEWVEVTRVGVNFSVANDTDAWVAVPIEFKLYLGDGELVDAWDDAATIPFAEADNQDGSFIVKPGEQIDLTIDNVPALVDALNSAATFGIGYKAIYRMADFGNGADLWAFLDKFGLCLLGLFTGYDVGDCPGVEEMLGWHLTIKKFELEIEAKSDLDIPEIPGCEDFAKEYDLDLLGEACPVEE